MIKNNNKTSVKQFEKFELSPKKQEAVKGGIVNNPQGGSKPIGRKR